MLVHLPSWLRLVCGWTLTVLTLSAAEIIPYGSGWRYEIALSEASSPDATAWRKPGFDDSSWTPATAPIGYANPPNSPEEQTLVTLIPSSQEVNYSSVFIRGTFVAKNPSPGNVFTVNANVDDGCVVWINGVEIGRNNVPAGDLAYNQWASTAGEEVLTAFSISNTAQGPIVPGTNVIAVQVFNANATSSDLFFDLSLESDLDEQAPTVISTDPPPGTLTELQAIDVTFSENVTGVDASDLLINGNPASAITVISPREYSFSFPAQPNGQVTVAWAPTHRITDLTGNPFGGGGWVYTLQPADPNAAVILSEFLADNQHGIKDEDDDRTDWIELLNSGSTIANLNGWFVTDDASNLTKWRFPAVSLDTGRYLLVFASGKDRTNSSAPLHTNFKIGKSSGYLALVDPTTNVVSQFSPYPAQTSDISYGRDATSPNLMGYLPIPTPGAANVASGPGISPAVTISVPGGVYTNNSVAVSLQADAGQIRFTTDGSVPTLASSLYAGTINVSSCIVLKARVFQTGLLPGPVAAESYTLVDSSVQNFTSNLPLLLVSTGGRSINQDTAVRTLASIIAVDPYRGRSAVVGQPEYVGEGGIEVRGQTSSGFPKQQYNFTFEDPYRQQGKAGLFGLPSGSDWVLYAPYSDKPFLQDFLAYELYEKMGHYSVRRRFVEMFLNKTAGKLNYNRDYVGIYILEEKIRIEDNRVDIDRLTPYNSKEPEISGGYMFKKDKDSPGDYNFSTPGSPSAGFSGQGLKLHQPKPVDATTAQKNWLKNYLAQMERALYAPNWKTATGTNHWSYYIDADSFVDYHWIVEFAKQIDGYRLSNYFYKPRNGKVHMSPIWDWNLSFGNADYLDGENTENWYWQELSDTDHIWLRRLMCGTSDPNGTTGDPDFNQRIIDRWSELRTNVLSSTNVIARAKELSSLLSEAAPRDFQRWPRLGTYIWPNPPLYANPTTFAGIIQSFTNWIQGRYTWIDSQFLPVPALGLAGGLTRPGANLTFATPARGAVYYTMDRSDPRSPGGTVSPRALRYIAPVTIKSNSSVFARVLNGTVWSGPSVRSFTVERPTLAITEIMYHPAEPLAASPYGESDFEFVEFRNTGTVALPLEGITISGGIQFTFGPGTLQPGDYIVVVKNAAAFQSRYGQSATIAGVFSGELSNGGDNLTVTGALGEAIASVAFKDGWYPVTDGAGFSLVPRYDESSDEELSDASAWQPSTQEGGSPGGPEVLAPAVVPSVLVSELLAHPIPGSPQKIELQNSAASPADVSGWYLTDNLQKPKKFQIPGGTVIAPGGFLVLTSDDFGKLFTFNATGGEAYLFSADASGALTGYEDGFEYGAQPEGRSAGRYVGSNGQELFVLQNAPTLGQTNAGPWASPVIISEIMYHPPDVITNNGTWNDTEDEYIEIVNRSTQPVQLFDRTHLTNTWHIDGGVKFAFPQEVILQPSGVALLVNFDPIANALAATNFRLKYALPPNVPLFGPFQGNLGNDGDLVSLQAPDSAVVTPDAAYYVEDEVQYSDHSPWNAGADGFGFALSRVDLVGFGNDPVGWTATRPSPGLIPALSAAPVITTQPVSQFLSVGQNTSLTVQASGTETLQYQWLFNGNPLSQATSPVLNLSNLQLTNSGNYSVIVANSASAVSSDRASVIISPDTDGDGMPDQWEYTYGLNPFDPSDGSQDADGDGFSNRDEFLAGTNPRQKQSSLALSLSPNGAIEFFAAPDRSYSVLYSESLSAQEWKKLADTRSTPSGSAVSIVDRPSNAQRYYRLVTPAISSP